MSRFFSEKYRCLTPYTPGEQPRDTSFIKLNTNESPYPPSDKVLSAVSSEAEKLMLYSDPQAKLLTEKLAKRFEVLPENVIVGNGSDEILNFCFMSFFDTGVVFPDITYGFYPVYATLCGIPYREIPLKEDFTVDIGEYVGIGENIVIANPNAPTGILISLFDIERVVKSNPDKIVLIDEAYIDFGGESAIPLTKKYSNLIVVGTFSKSRSMAGARLGFAIANKALISDLNTVRYSTNPYNVNRMTLAAGCAAIDDDSYYIDNCKRIEESRDYIEKELLKRAFSVTDSKANFVFASSDKITGEELYSSLRKKGILVRHFDKERIKNHNRITVGRMEDMKKLISAIDEILKEKENEKRENKS